MRTGHAHATVLLWRSKDTSWFAPSTVDFGDQTPIVGSPSKSFYLLNHLSGASHFGFTGNQGMWISRSMAGECTGSPPSLASIA